jgi:hypothetical protein
MSPARMLLLLLFFLRSHIHFRLLQLVVNRYNVRQRLSTSSVTLFGCVSLKIASWSDLIWQNQVRFLFSFFVL